ncbi:hypothetical protein [Paenibacillus alginolyticus]|uniref:hypothetical protein n=1 Tax=Paenibacillus alginolyticus TaxID=59839 RepID=UPI0035E41A89
MDSFREIVNVRYALIPYIYAQSIKAAAEGLPMFRALCIDYPDDPLAWIIDDEYLFGDSMLVAPLFHSGQYSRKVYVPNGTWIDYQTHKAYEGGRYHVIDAGSIPIVVLVKDGAAIPHVPVAQSTQDIDWGALEYVAYVAHEKKAVGQVCLPGGQLELRTFDVQQGAQDGLRIMRFLSLESK